MSESSVIVSDLLLSKFSPLVPSKTPAASKPTNPGRRSRSNIGGTNKITAKRSAKETTGSLRDSVIDSISTGLGGRWLTSWITELKQGLLQNSCYSQVHCSMKSYEILAINLVCSFFLWRESDCSIQQRPPRAI